MCITYKSGSGVDLLYSSSRVRNLIAGANIYVNRRTNAVQPEDGQIKFDVDLSSY